MKNYKVIFTEIKKNNETIENLKEQADKLLKIPELDSCGSFWGNGKFDAQKYKSIKESITKDEEQKACELYAQADELRKINEILQCNLKASFCDSAINIITSILEKYEGKPLGEKTKEKIRNEGKAFNLTFYFDSDESIKVATLGANGCLDYVVRHETLYAIDKDGHRAKLLIDNKLQPLENIILKHHFEYVEKPKQKVKQIEKLLEKYKNACINASKLQGELNDLLPKGGTIHRFDKVNYCGENSFKW